MPGYLGFMMGQRTRRLSAYYSGADARDRVLRTVVQTPLAIAANSASRNLFLVPEFLLSNFDLVP
jgi:hypothetical protein